MYIRTLKELISAFALMRLRYIYFNAIEKDQFNIEKEEENT